MGKRKETNDYTFLVDDVKEIVDKNYKYDMMNMLGYLAFRHIYYTEHRKANNNFFYVSAEEFHKEIGISKNIVTAYAVRFVKDKLIDYCSGKMHHPSNYRLLWNVEELEVHHPEAQDVYTPQTGTMLGAENEVTEVEMGASIKNEEKRIKNEEKEERIGTSDNSFPNEGTEGDTEISSSLIEEEISSTTITTEDLMNYISDPEEREDVMRCARYYEVDSTSVLNILLTAYRWDRTDIVALSQYLGENLNDDVYQAIYRECRDNGEDLRSLNNFCRSYHYTPSVSV